MVKQKEQEKKEKTVKKKDKPLSDLATCFYSLGMMGIALNIAANALKDSLMSEDRIHLLELKKMGATFIETRYKKTERIYLPISKVDGYIKSFLKNNKGYKLEKTEIGKLNPKDKTAKEMFYYSLVKQEKIKPRKESEDVCPECGRGYDYD